MDKNNFLSGMAGFNKSTKSISSTELSLVPVDHLFAEKQDRNDWDSDSNKSSLQELVNSIHANNNTINQPIAVLKIENNRYLIIAGERRWRAAKILGLLVVPCIIYNDLDKKEVQFIRLSENIDRKDLSPMQKAHAFNNRMKEFNLTASELAKKVGCSKDKIFKSLKLLKISPVLQELVLDGIVIDPRSLSIIDKMDSDQIKIRADLLRKGTINLGEAIKKNLPSDNNQKNSLVEKTRKNSISVIMPVCYLIYSRMTRKNLEKSSDNDKIIKKYFKKLENKYK